MLIYLDLFINNKYMKIKNILKEFTLELQSKERKDDDFYSEYWNRKRIKPELNLNLQK